MNNNKDCRVGQLTNRNHNHQRDHRRLHLLEDCLRENVAQKHHHRRYHCDHPNSTETIIINVIIADFTFWKMVSGRTWRRSTAVRASLSVSRAVSVEDGT